MRCHPTRGLALVGDGDDNLVFCGGSGGVGDANLMFYVGNVVTVVNVGTVRGSSLRLSTKWALKRTG